MNNITMLRMRARTKDLSEVYSIFSNDKRLMVFWLLLEGEMTVNEISQAVDTSIQNTSQHLRLMKAKRILATRRDGKEIYYRIADTEIGHLCRAIHHQAVNFKSD